MQLLNEKIKAGIVKAPSGGPGSVPVRRGLHCLAWSLDYWIDLTMEEDKAENAQPFQELGSGPRGSEGGTTGASFLFLTWAPHFSHARVKGGPWEGIKGTATSWPSKKDKKYTTECSSCPDIDSKIWEMSFPKNDNKTREGKQTFLWGDSSCTHLDFFCTFSS